MTPSDWFKGDKDALDLYGQLVNAAHTWDDVVDKDKDVDEESANQMVEALLLHIPGNPFYRRFEGEMRGIMITSCASYRAANLMEKSGDEHQLELAHYLRYVVANVVIFMIAVIHGFDKAAPVIAEAYPVLVPERLADYVKEHVNA